MAVPFFVLFVVFVVKYLSSIFRYAASPNRVSLNWSLPAPAKKSSLLGDLLPTPLLRRHAHEDRRASLITGKWGLTMGWQCG